MTCERSAQPAPRDRQARASHQANRVRGTNLAIGEDVGAAPQARAPNSHTPPPTCVIPAQAGIHEPGGTLCLAVEALAAAPVPKRRLSKRPRTSIPGPRLRGGKLFPRERSRSRGPGMTPEREAMSCPKLGVIPASENVLPMRSIGQASARVDRKSPVEVCGPPDPAGLGFSSLAGSAWRARTCLSTRPACS
jgi:hypothetical protein